MPSDVRSCTHEETRNDKEWYKEILRGAPDSPVEKNLLTVIAAWPKLPGHIKRAITELAQASDDDQERHNPE